MTRAVALLLLVPLLGCAEPSGPELPAVFEEVSAGGHHTCAVGADGTFCWGDGRFGQLGGVLDERCAGRVCPVPVAVVGLPRVEQVAAGLWHTCAIAGGDLFCWGYHRFGQLGAGETVADRCATEYSLPCASVPTAVRAGVAFSDVTAARYHSCALDAGGQLYCWGDNSQGQAGSGVRGGGQPYPRATPTDLRFRTVSTGFAHTCGGRERW